MTSGRNREGRFYELREKNGKSVLIEIEYPAIENALSSSIRQWKKDATLIVSDSMSARKTYIRK